MKYFILLLVLLATGVSAQQPVIDSMLTTESKNELSIYGDFGGIQGQVWCDSIELEVISWSSALITAALPATGKGSAGPVTIGSRGYRSEARMLSIWSGSIGRIYSENVFGSFGSTYILEFSLRLDLHSILRSGKEGIRNFEPCYSSIYKTSESQIHAGTPLNGWHSSATLKMRDDLTQYNDGFRAGISFTAASMTLSIGVHEVKGVFREDFDNGVPTISPWNAPVINATSTFDSNAHVIGFKVDELSGPRSYQTYYLEMDNPKFLPPQKAIELNKLPSIIAPPKNYIEYGSEVSFRWEQMKDMDSFQLQISTDTLFNDQTIICDVVIADTTYSFAEFQPMKTYFWRVRGENAEGKSRWSEQSTFSTASKGEVHQLSHNLFSIQLNPFVSKTAFVFSLSAPSMIHIQIYDLFGKKIWSFSDFYIRGGHVDYHSDLRPGQYIVRFRTEKSDQTALLIKI